MGVQMKTAILTQFIENVNALDQKADLDFGHRLESEARRNPELWLPTDWAGQYYQKLQLLGTRPR